MDPRPQAKRSCGSSRGRARGQTRPRVQSQPVYRPRFESPPPPSQHVFRSAPVNYNQTTYNDPNFYGRHENRMPPPMYNNYSSYDMDQLWTPREPAAAFVDDEEEEEDVEVVADTQPEVQFVAEEEEEEDDEVQEIRPKKADRKMWEPEEEETLAKCWVKVSVDRNVGDRQRRVAFWKRITAHYARLMPGATRTHHQLNSKWNQMHPLMQSFNGYYIQAVRLNQSGCNDMDILERAKADWARQYKKTFLHERAWRVVKDQPKWLESPVVGEGTSASGSSKKRKSSDSSNAPATPQSDAGIDFRLPCLNEDPNPSRVSKGKKKAQPEGSQASARETLSCYADRKTSLLEAQLESQRKKDEEYFGLVEQEKLTRDMDFVWKPHEQISDPAFREFVINKKREICAARGWPCTL